jgi:hypothetical protein
VKAYFLWTVTGPQLIVTSYDFVQHPELLKKLADTGITKFVAQEVSLDLVRERYGEHFQGVLTDPDQTDELRNVETSPRAVLNKFSFKELGEPIYYEP